MQTIERLAKPKSQMAHLLYDMIRGRMIAEQQYQYNRFRGTLADLRNEFSVPILYVDVPFTNRFKRPGKYRKHFITQKGRVSAIKVYNKINK